MKSIGVIGVGIMGRGIVENYLKNGYKVIIWNRTASKIQDLIEGGAVLAKTPKDCVSSSDIVFEVSANDESSREIWTGKNGILEAAKPSKPLITCATLSVDWVLELAELCQQRNLSFYDMPMTGGRKGAVTGQLILLASGDEQGIERIKPDLQAITKDVKYFGPVGSGTKYKLILNSLQSVHLTAFGEAMRMASEVGLNIQTVGEALAELPGGYTTQLSWQCYQEQPKPINFSVNWLAKDLDYAHKMTSGEFPLMDEAQKRFEEAKKDGHGEDDWSVVNKP